jgi:hypothetical protein
MDDKLKQLGYRLGVYGKIVINEREVYYGCIDDADSKIGLAKISVIPWRDKDIYPRTFNQIPVPLNKFHIYYDKEGN